MGWGIGHLAQITQKIPKISKASLQGTRYEFVEPHRSIFWVFWAPIPTQNMRFVEGFSAEDPFKKMAFW